MQSFPNLSLGRPQLDSISSAPVTTNEGLNSLYNIRCAGGTRHQINGSDWGSQRRALGTTAVVKTTEFTQTQNQHYKP